MSTPRHRQATFDDPCRGKSTSDPPIYLALVRDLYGDDALGPMAEWDLRILQEVLDGLKALDTDRATPEWDLRILQEVLDGLKALDTDRATPDRRVADFRQLPAGAPGELPQLPKREPGAQLPPGVRPYRVDTRGCPPVPETRQTAREPFSWLPPQVAVAGGR